MRQAVSDESLIARVAHGDRSAFETLYDRYAARVLGLLTQVTGERDAAEELLQQVFWQVWQSAGTFRLQHRAVTSWLFAIASSLTTADYFQRNPGRQLFLEWNDEDSVMDPNRQAVQVRSALRSLPPEPRRVIEMAYFQGMTRQEIANATGKPLETISSLAKQGL